MPLYATAYLNLTEVDDSNPPTAAAAAAAAAASDPTQARALRTCFTQPGVMPDFLEKVREKQVIRVRKTVMSIIYF